VCAVADFAVTKRGKLDIHHRPQRRPTMPSRAGSGTDHRPKPVDQPRSGDGTARTGPSDSAAGQDTELSHGCAPSHPRPGRPTCPARRPALARSRDNQSRFKFRVLDGKISDASRQAVFAGGVIAATGLCAPRREARGRLVDGGEPLKNESHVKIEADAWR